MPVSIGGRLVTPGDAVIADDDGVVVVPRREVTGAVAAATARVTKETATRAALAAGELGLDRYGLRAVLAEQGVEFLDYESYLAAMAGS